MVIVVIISVNYYVKNQDVVTIKSDIDGRMYRIADTPDRQQVADLLANVNKGALKLTLLVSDIWIFDINWNKI